MAIDEILSALAEPTRRRIIEALADEAKAVGALVAELEISQPTVSKHLKVLREAQLVTMTAAGQRRIYSLDTSAVDELMDWCARFVPVEALAVPAEPESNIDAAAENSALSPAAAQLSRSVGRSLEQVTGRAQEFFDRFQRFGRRR